jgi:hypothetical protein
MVVIIQYYSLITTMISIHLNLILLHSSSYISHLHLLFIIVSTLPSSFSLIQILLRNLMYLSFYHLMNSYSFMNQVIYYHHQNPLNHLIHQNHYSKFIFVLYSSILYSINYHYHSIPTLLLVSTLIL